MTRPEPALVQRAAVLTDVNRAADAIVLLHRAVGLVPGDQRAWCELGRAELSCNQPHNALTAANRALAVDPAQEWPHRLASIALGLLGQHDGAVRAAREAVRLAPDAWQTHVQLADALAEAPAPRWARGQLRAEAWAAANRAVELAPLEPDPHCTVGHLLVASQAAPQARRAFREALRLDPGNARALNGLGLVGMRTGRLVAAAADFGAAAAADPYDSVARGNISAAVWNASLKMCWGLLAAAILCLPLIFLPVQVGWGAAAVGALALGLLAVLIRRRVPRPLHGYLLRLPLRDRWLGATLALAAVTVLLVGTALLAPTQEVRGTSAGLAIQATLVLSVVRRLGVWHYARVRR